MIILIFGYNFKIMNFLIFEIYLIKFSYIKLHNQLMFDKKNDKQNKNQVKTEKKN